MSVSEPIPAAEEETSLLERLRAGDGDAFATLVRNHMAPLLACARRLLNHEEDARDAVQDAFLSAFKALDRFEGQSRLGTWLYRIVLNAALSKLRTRQRKPERLIEEMLPKFLEDGHQAQPAIEWRGSSDRDLQCRETRQLVRDAIEQLPEAYRTVLRLRDIEGLDTESTAQILELNVALVKTRLHRARQALRGLLDPHFRRGDL
jgi:RNA polymerase sigma-70 factor (ECF subfamily)